MRTDAIIILDGFGIAPESEFNAIRSQGTPYFDSLCAQYPVTRLNASGRAVGLPEGQMGNSEVGHLNIGAGRVVYQDITAIDNAIEDGSFFANPAIEKAMDAAKEKALHIVGLLGNGGVHSSIKHLFALIDSAKLHGVRDLKIHCITDGRDTAPQSAAGFIAEVEAKLASAGVGKIATVCGRFYYMDRDNRWERVEQGYNCVFEGEGKRCDSAAQAVEASYKEGVTDEFILPTVIGDYAGVGEGDGFIFYNFRADRAREITRAAIEPDFDKFPRRRGFLRPVYVGMTEYSADFRGLYTAFPPKDLKNTLGEWLSVNKKSQLRIAETEKYAHVTFFFNGGVEKPNDGETRILIPSPKVATYDLKPEMSAYEVAHRAAEKVGEVDVLILNFANCDMVGHTGVFSAAKNAVAAVDECLKTVVEAVLKTGGTAIVTADHGNAEKMAYPDGSPMTAHTVNPVPMVVVGERFRSAELDSGALCDIAPTFLEIIGLDAPAEMTGKSLIKK